MEIYYDLFVIYAISLLTFALYGWDKHLAVYQKTRIPEFILLLFSFLCGAFVPAEYLPSSVLNFAHILPAYYYINSNDLLKNIDVINISSMHPIIINMVIIIIFSILFIILNNIVTRKKRKSN